MICKTFANCYEARLKTVSIITVGAATQVSTLESAGVLPADVSPLYSPTSSPDVFGLNLRAMDRTEQVTYSLVEKETRLPAKKGTVRTPEFSNFPICIRSSFFYPLHKYLRYSLSQFRIPQWYKIIVQSITRWCTRYGRLV